MFGNWRKSAIAIVAGTAAVGLVVFMVRPAKAQMPQQPEGDGEAHFTTNVGSFKILGLNDKAVSGELNMTASGTILVTGVDKAPTTTGNLKLEYSYPSLQKYAFHGTGTLDLKGPFRSLQWFGTDLKADFHGRAKIRLVGEFDKDLNTGLYWTTDPKKKDFWSANSIFERVVPDYTSATGGMQSAPTSHELPAGSGN